MRDSVKGLRKAILRAMAHERQAAEAEREARAEAEADAAERTAELVGAGYSSEFDDAELEWESKAGLA